MMYFVKVVSSLKLLKPIAVAIAQIEGDNDILSDAQTLLADVREEVCSALPTSLLLLADETAVLKYIKKREDFCLKLIHATAYMLDPKYAGKSILSGAEINKAYGVITTVSRHLGLDEGKVHGSLAMYTSKQGLWDGVAIWQSCQHISSATWWKDLCGAEALSRCLHHPPNPSNISLLREHLVFVWEHVQHSVHNAEQYKWLKNLMTA